MMYTNAISAVTPFQETQEKGIIISTEYPPVLVEKWSHLWAESIALYRRRFL